MQGKKPVGKILMVVDSISPHLYDPKSPTTIFTSIPDTIEDEISPVSRAFADKVAALGGMMTPYGIRRDPSATVTGKRYMRLAKAFFCVGLSSGERYVEDTEFRIRSHVLRNKNTMDWEGMTAHFVRCLKLAILHRHKPGVRNPVYANKE